MKNTRGDKLKGLYTRFSFAGELVQIKLRVGLRYIEFRFFVWVISFSLSRGIFSLFLLSTLYLIIPLRTILRLEMKVNEFKNDA